MNLQAVLRRTLMILGVATMIMSPRPGRGAPGAEPGPATEQRSGQLLSYEVDEGSNLNSFLREGPVAAHLLLRSGLDPRVLVAFPAGNSGVGLWFSHGAEPVSWALQGRPQPLTTQDV